MPYSSKGKRDRMRRRIAQRVRAGETCALCQRPINLDLKYPHPEAFVVDHIRATHLGGGDGYENGQPAHNSCNRAKSSGPNGTVGRNSGALD